MSVTTVSKPLAPVNPDDAPARPFSLSFAPHYRAGNAPRRKPSLAKRVRRCKLCQRAPSGICGRHSRESRRGALRRTANPAAHEAQYHTQAYEAISLPLPYRFPTAQFGTGHSVPAALAQVARRRSCTPRNSERHCETVL
jgi:hypothetical protein